MKTLIYISLISLILFSCKKDKLEGDMLILEGKWKWVSSYQRKTEINSGINTHSYIDASDFNDTYHVEFDRKGKIKFIKNGNIEEEYRIVFSFFRDDPCQFTNCKSFSIYLNNDDEHEFGGRIGQDTMSCAGQPLPLMSYSENGYEYSHSHYYIRDN